jgi:hypothetical protein
MLASAAPPGTPDVDLLVLQSDQTVVASLQVKTRTYGADKGWHMSLKHESIVGSRLFYAFVDLEPDMPVSYIVPSAVVADMLRSSHQAWLASPGKGGRKRNDHPMRRMRPSHEFDIPGYPNGWLEQYREQWDLLKTDPGPEAG